jgi:hypothetical protein
MIPMKLMEPNFRLVRTFIKLSLHFCKLDSSYQRSVPWKTHSLTSTLRTHWGELKVTLPKPRMPSLQFASQWTLERWVHGIPTLLQVQQWSTLHVYILFVLARTSSCFKRTPRKGWGLICTFPSISKHWSWITRLLHFVVLLWAMVDNKKVDVSFPNTTLKWSLRCAYIFEYAKCIFQRNPLKS